MHQVELWDSRYCTLASYATRPVPIYPQTSELDQP